MPIAEPIHSSADGVKAVALGADVVSIDTAALWSVGLTANELEVLGVKHVGE